MNSDSLADLLANHGIRLRSQAAGHTEKVRCPQCEGGRTRELSLSVRIDDDGCGAVWQCHRGHCGWRNGERLNLREHRTNLVRSPPREAVMPPDVQPSEQQKPRHLYAFFAERGISQETVDAFGCYITIKAFRDLGDQPAIVFPYRYRRAVVNRKYRPPQKHPQLQERDALPTLFNVDSITTPDVVCWVEGEPDVMAMHEVGYPQTVSLKDGAPAELRDESDPRRQDDKRFLALSTHHELLATVQRFILAGDADAPGGVLREELARRLGRHRCWLVTWPTDCKDAGDVLKLHGADVVRACIEAAEPYPIEGLQRIKPGTLRALRHSRPPPVLTTGVGACDDVLKLPGEGRLIVITGIPNHGKSSWFTFVMVHLMERHDRKFLVFTPEMQPWEQYAALCSQIIMNKPFWPKRDVESMSDDDIDAAEDWLRQRLTMLVSDAEDQPPTLDWMLERARVSVLRDGVTDLAIDPWNEIEHSRGELSETEYLGRALQRLRAFGFRHGCNIWIVAHPTKLVPDKPGAKIGPPGLYAISGGANWANKTDLGITIHTPDRITEVHLTKARFQRWGRRGAKADLEFNQDTGRYTTPMGAL